MTGANRRERAKPCAEDKQKLLATQQFLMKALDTIRNQKNALQIERLQLESMKTEVERSMSSPSHCSLASAFTPPVNLNPPRPTNFELPSQASEPFIHPSNSSSVEPMNFCPELPFQAQEVNTNSICNTEQIKSDKMLRLSAETDDFSFLSVHDFDTGATRAEELDLNIPKYLLESNEDVESSDDDDMPITMDMLMFGDHRA